MSNERRSWICSTADVEGGGRLSTAPVLASLETVADLHKLWPLDTTLRVRFLEGEPDLHRRVLDTASAWLVPGVRLNIVAARPDEPAQVRIAFDPTTGSWSAVGTDSERWYTAEKPTMNLGWARMDTPEEDFSSVVIHEFGHALGLLHEHNHPGARIHWNVPAVNADLGGPPNNWDLDKIKFNVYDPYEASNVVTTDFDDVSVMIYTIPANWTLGGRAFMPSWKLSVGDAEGIRVLYSESRPQQVG